MLANMTRETALFYLPERRFAANSQVGHNPDHR
jgi:hypothetical protein